MENTGINLDDIPDSAYLQIVAVTLALRISRDELFNLVNTKNFPHPKQITEGIPVWQVGEIKEWLSENKLQESI